MWCGGLGERHGASVPRSARSAPALGGWAARLAPRVPAPLSQHTARPLHWPGVTMALPAQALPRLARACPGALARLAVLLGAVLAARALDQAAGTPDQEGLRALEALPAAAAAADPFAAGEWRPSPPRSPCSDHDVRKSTLKLIKEQPFVGLFHHVSWPRPAGDGAGGAHGRGARKAQRRRRPPPCTHLPPSCATNPSSRQAGWPSSTARTTWSLTPRSPLVSSTTVRGSGGAAGREPAAGRRGGAAAHACSRPRLPPAEFHFRGPSNRLIRDKGEEDSQARGAVPPVLCMGLRCAGAAARRRPPCRPPSTACPPASCARGRSLRALPTFQKTARSCS